MNESANRQHDSVTGGSSISKQGMTEPRFSGNLLPKLPYSLSPSIKLATYSSVSPGHKGAFRTHRDLF